uniref:Cytochrome b6-f complex subunit 6 n=1 Tax=Ishige okamurae TaxID=233772 RepID=A0A8E5XRI8_9PHAE|nr:cytochrome b6/f complex subunit VI [Ishige okamurae]QVJ99639.1 cytochrome b6/f complex subunit VI [Ishige okamurae]
MSVIVDYILLLGLAFGLAAGLFLGLKGIKLI